MEYIVVALVILLVLVLFSKGKNRDIENSQIFRVKQEVNTLLAVIQEYFQAIAEHQKLIMELKESINLLNAHFIMSSAEIEKHFPEVNC